MDLTKSQNPNAMTLGSAKIEITQTPVAIDTVAKNYTLSDLLDLGLARGVKITPSSTKSEVKADNGIVPLRGQTDKKVTVEFSLLERHLPVIAKVMAGIVTVESEPGVLATVTDTHPVGTVQKNVPIPLSKFNHDGAEPANLVVKQSEGAGLVNLVEGLDFAVVPYAGAFFVVIISPADTGNYDAAKDVRITYDVTPAKSYTLYHGSAGVSKNLAMRLTNKRKADDGRIISRTWELPYGFCTSEDVITLKSKNDADTVAEIPFSFEFTPHPDMAILADMEPKSLMREKQEV